MAEEEPQKAEEEEEVRLGIGIPLDLPLTEKQHAQMRDPGQFSWEEEFYILYDLFAHEIAAFNEAMAMRKLLQGLGGAMLTIGPDGPQFGNIGDSLGSMVVKAVDCAKGGWYLGSCALSRYPEGDHLFYLPEEIDQDKLNWGRTLSELISTDKVLQQVWSMRADQLVIRAKMSVELCLEVELRFFRSTDEATIADHRKVIEATAPLAAHDNVSIACAEKAAREYWNKNEPCPQEVVTKAMQAYNDKHKDELKKLHAARDKVTQEARDRQATMASKEAQNKIETSNSSEAQKESTQTMSQQLTPATPKATTADKKDENPIKFANVSVMYVEDPKMKHIQLPQGMTFFEAHHWLRKIEEEESRKVAFQYKFKGWYPFDAMWALYRAMAEVYGFVHVADFTIKTMFGEMKEPPSMVTIDIDQKTKQQIPWGPVEINGVSAPLTPSIAFDQGLPVLEITAEIKNKERGSVDKLMAAAEKLLKESSIYRGKAVEIDFTIFSPRDIRFDVARAPKFMDTDIKEGELIFPEEVQDLLDTSLLTPIRHTQVCREQKIPLRRGVLLAGKYGVGKTLAARLTAKLCEDNGWTFLYLKDLNQLPQALYFAKRYGPCVVFAEDINRVVSGTRDAHMDQLFNVVDGIDRKNDEVMIVFTTNDLDDIHAGMLRPGRIDTVIKVLPPDARAAEKLVRLYGREIIDVEADLTKVGTMLQGQIPAIIREAVERSKLAAIKDTKSGEKLVVRATHLETAARQMLVHAELLEDPPAPKPDLVILAEALAAPIAQALRDNGTVNEDASNADALKYVVGAALDGAGRPGDDKKTETPEA